MDQVIIVGGGLAGLSAAHTVLEHGGNVFVLDKNAFFGGNSTKATSGINGAGTRAQRTHGVSDSAEIFEADTLRGGAKRPDLAKVLTHESGPAVEWLIDHFGLDLSLISRLGGHSQPRTHRGKEKFPGMTITYALMETLEDLSESKPDRVRIAMKSRMTKLLKNDKGEIYGVEYVQDGKTFQQKGSVIIATGGYGADYEQDSLLQKYRPELTKYPTTNGDHCTGDGIKVAVRDAGADTVDLEWVQVHPTGLVHPDEPDAKLKFLAAEALRGCGGLILDANGKRIANELGRRDYVSGEMMKNKGPFRLLLNSKASKELDWHTKHYKGRGLMKSYKNIKELATDMKVPYSNLEETWKSYNANYEKQTADPEKGPFDAYGGGKSWDKFGKKYYHNMPVDLLDEYHVAIITPVVHYTMGGVCVDQNAQLSGKNGPIPGLFGAGEVNGGIHGQNRLGGSSLLDCVVYGRVAGRSAAKYMLEKNTQFFRAKL
eukprot:GEMP01011916.1.p1 GENE.GEMP01011916.1~~GEMP01011916.1.p1  ORF type:complete len:486 (+),score=121.47 GEMP01011916.1:51-1508(+)